MAQDFITINPAAARQLAERSAVPLIVSATERVAMRARALAPGHMKEHIRAINQAKGATAVGIVMSDHHATTFVIYGTKPHPIYPRKPGGVLRFTMNGKITFARMVHHPGTRANNFLMKALLESKFL